MAFYCIIQGNFGDLPWLTAMVGFPWTAYAVSQMYYYKKSEKENTAGGIKYERVMAEINKMKEYREQMKAQNNFSPELIYILVQGLFLFLKLIFLKNYGIILM